MSKKKIAIIIAAAVALLFLPHEVRATKTIPADGPYAVGVRVETVDYEGRAMRIVTWYPALQDGGVGYKFREGIRGSGVLDAAPDKSGAPYPLLLFSHGLGGTAAQSVYYCQNLASYGYVVVSGDHADSDMIAHHRPPAKNFFRFLGKLPHTTAAGFGMDFTLTMFADYFMERGFDLSYRPREAKFVIDYALARNASSDDPLSGTMDPDRIGATGHSLGGFTCIMIGGVPFRCSEARDPNGPSCDPRHLDPLDTDMPCCFKYIQEMDPYAMRDERVKAILPLAPAIFVPGLKNAAKELRIPIMLITGESVLLEAPWPPIKTLYDNAPAPKYLVRIRKTDHITVADAALRMGVSRIVLPGYRCHFRDKAQVYKDYPVAFFDLYLKHDAGRAAILKKPSSRFVKLWSEAD